MPTSFDKKTNIAQLPYDVAHKLHKYLNSENNWHKIVNVLPEAEALSAHELNLIINSNNPGNNLFILLGNRGITVPHFIILLDKCRLLAPQLILRRSFAPIKIKRPATIAIDIHHCTLSVAATGFPYPNYEWQCNEESICSLPSSSGDLLLTICVNCTKSGSYRCKIWNKIPDGVEWMPAYKYNNRETESVEYSDVLLVDMETNPELCQSCREHQAVARLIELDLHKEDYDDSPRQRLPHVSIDDSSLHTNTVYTAVDKVALVIANSEYLYMPSLKTPPCDAQTIASGLLELGFKTVTLVDLNYQETVDIINEYENLLGAQSVYAVFYYVGHGFEHAGQCYLLPVDAPGLNYTARDCISVDWILSKVQSHQPSLNLILLDMCRKYPPHDLTEFQGRRYELKQNRNTVFGYATSVGVGAYEVRGEVRGVFVKYLQNHLFSDKPVVSALHAVLRDLARDQQAANVQFPELRTNLARPLSLADPLEYAGHTGSFDLRTMHWQTIYELPDPVHIHDEKHRVRLTIWFDYCGRFCNMAFAFTSTMPDPPVDDDAHDHTKKWHAYLKFEQPIETDEPTICEAQEEDISIRYLVKNLHKIKNRQLHCEITVIEMIDDHNSNVILTRLVQLPPLLVMRL